LAAFLAYAKAFSNNFKTLIDTYSTLETGILNTIIVSKALAEAGISDFGIRLDSGDLCELSKQCRTTWNTYMPQIPFTIYASDDLHEDRLVEMEAQGSQIDVYAIGTHIATCKKQPALGLVCKLTELNKAPRMKFSSDPEKATLPCNKAIYRVWTDEKEEASFDLIALE
jgi:nicotinate phosphoribosyltransferase